MNDQMPQSFAGLGVDLTLEDRVPEAQQVGDFIEACAEDLEQASMHDPLVASLAKLAVVAKLDHEQYMTILARELLRANRRLQETAYQTQSRSTPELMMEANKVHEAISKALGPSQPLMTVETFTNPNHVPRIHGVDD